MGKVVQNLEWFMAMAVYKTPWLYSAGMVNGKRCFNPAYYNLAELQVSSFISAKKYGCNMNPISKNGGKKKNQYKSKITMCLQYRKQCLRFKFVSINSF